MKRKTFVKSSQIVQDLLDHLGLDATNFALFDVWEREAGTWSQHAKAVGIRQGRLIIDISSPACYQELKLRKDKLLATLNGHFGKTVVNNIQFRLKGGM